LGWQPLEHALNVEVHLKCRLNLVPWGTIKRVRRIIACSRLVTGKVVG
jgi:hypothetical protein